jgi:hypothetical protein
MGQGIVRIALDGTPRGGERRRKDDRWVRAATSHRKLASEGQFGPARERLGSAATALSSSSIAFLLPS